MTAGISPLPETQAVEPSKQDQSSPAWWSHEIEIPNLRNDTRPPKMFYSLAEAADIAKCLPSDLLHYGGMGKIKLLISVPDGVDVKLFDLTAKEAGTSFFHPEMLILSPPYCRQVECNGKTEQSEFSAGYAMRQYFDPSGFTSKNKPPPSANLYGLSLGLAVRGCISVSGFASFGMSFPS